MKRNIRSAALSVFFLVLLTLQAAAAGGNYVSSKQVDVAKLLPPPPAADSDQTRAELEEILNIQRTITSKEEAAAQEDAEESIFRFADVMGSKFTPGYLHIAAGFFERLTDDVNGIIRDSKHVWDRPRPFLVNPAIRAIVMKSKSSSYPSGHSTFAWTSAIVLANMVPEKKDAIFARAAQYGRNRVAGGVHYPSDIEAGKTLGTAIADAAMQNPAFQKDFDRAKAEVRKILGYQ